jgi:drug/metabolite transporter (DMT)-like permease
MTPSASAASKSASAYPASRDQAFGLLPLDADKASIKAGILWMLVTTFLFVCQDSTVRILLQSYPATEIAFARYFIHFVVATCIVGWRNPGLVRSRRPALQLLRSSLVLGITLFGMLALRIMPFVDCAAVLWIAPVLVTALSVLVLHERVSLAGWLSVVAGLVGVWVIVNPPGVALSPAMLFPVLAALCSALYQIATRMLHSTDPPLTTLFYTAIAGVVFCGALLPFVGLVPTLADGALMLLLGGLGVTSHFCMIRAFTAAPANIVAPFGYTALLWATLFSLLLFSETPSARTMVGAGLIVAAGLFIFLRERRHRRSPSRFTRHVFLNPADDADPHSLRQ